MKTQIRAGHYYAAKYNGNNGDLVVGRVDSVRNGGRVVLTNLLTGKTSVKKIDVLQRRNKRISKAQAEELKALHLKTPGTSTKRRQVVRARAVALLPPWGPRKPPAPKEPTIQEIIDRLGAEMRQEIDKVILKYARRISAAMKKRRN